jgi:hypothetical protein
MIKYNFYGIVFILISLLTIPHSLKAKEENKTVNITASGSGATKDAAQQSALRSAIEQTFGVFISSKTEIFNDELVADEIASISSGNIQSYKILNESQLPDGSWVLTLNAIVSVDKLTSFVQSKGVSVEIQGGLFALNIKQQILNEKAEIQAVKQMIIVLNEVMRKSFNYSITSTDPKSVDGDNQKFSIGFMVAVKANENSEFCSQYFNKTMSSLSLNASEVSDYKSIEKKTYLVNDFTLRCKESYDKLEIFTEQSKMYSELFEVESGSGKLVSPGAPSRRWSLDPRYNKSHDNFLIVEFPENEKLVCTHGYNMHYTLSELEKINSYKVNPLNLKISYSKGGILLEGANYSIVFAPNTIGLANWDTARKSCEKLSLNGYEDWRLPSKAELEYILYYLKNCNIDGFDEINGDYYINFWTSDEINSEDAYSTQLSSSKSYVDSKNKTNEVRPVRSLPFNPNQLKEVHNFTNGSYTVDLIFKLPKNNLFLDKIKIRNSFHGNEDYSIIMQKHIDNKYIYLVERKDSSLRFNLSYTDKFDRVIIQPFGIDEYDTLLFKSSYNYGEYGHDVEIESLNLSKWNSFVNSKNSIKVNVQFDIPTPNLIAKKFEMWNSDVIADKLKIISSDFSNNKFVYIVESLSLSKKYKISYGKDFAKMIFEDITTNEESPILLDTLIRERR